MTHQRRRSHRIKGEVASLFHGHTPRSATWHRQAPGRLSGLLLSVVVACMFYHPGVVEAASSISRVSVSSDGTQGNGASGYLPIAVPFGRFVAISGNGQVVTFQSSASNLVEGDTNGVEDIFVHDIKTGTTTRVSVASDGSQANDYSTTPSLSADGRYVAFWSRATNLVSDDTNEIGDVFVHDRTTGRTVLASMHDMETPTLAGGKYPSISGGGNYVVFSSPGSLVGQDTNGDGKCEFSEGCDTNALDDVYVRDLRTGSTVRVSVASDGSEQPWGSGVGSQYAVISWDGPYVAFESDAANFVPGDSNGVKDIFVRGVGLGIDKTSRVSVASDGTEANNASSFPAISSDGRYVAFQSYADNLVRGDTNGASDIFVHDRETLQTTRVSISSDGNQGNGESYFPSISGDGRYVAFTSEADNLVPNDTNGKEDVFIHDRQTGKTTRISIADNGAEGDNVSQFQSLSADGRYVVFVSAAANLVSNDTNNAYDVFIVKIAGDLTVNSTGDAEDSQPGDGFCSTGCLVQGYPECTLRAALQEINAQAAPNTIAFQIPQDDPGYDSDNSQYVIRPASALPTVLQNVTINASEQKGGRIVLDGSSAGENVPGLMILAFDATLQGFTIQNFNGPGVVQDHEDGGGIKLRAMSILNNCGWGVVASGGANLHREGESEEQNVIQENGTGEGCQGGGVFTYGKYGVTARDIIIQGNGGPGILAKGRVDLSGVASKIIVSGNRGEGVHSVRSYLTLQGDGEFIGNFGRGIRAHGAVLVNGSLTSRDNSGWGISGYSVHLRRLPGSSDVNPHIVTDNGKQAACWTSTIKKNSPVIEPVEDGCPGGGVLAYKAVMTGYDMDVRSNGGPGILAMKKVWLSNPLSSPTPIRDNRGSGIQSQAGNIELEGNFEIAGNLGRGLHAWGRVRLEGPAVFENNSGWGVSGSSVHLQRAYGLVEDNPHVVRKNGKGSECWTSEIRSGDYVRFQQVENACPGGGVLAYKADMTGYDMAVQSNGGPGILAYKGISLIAGGSPTEISGNLGDGLRTNTGKIVLQGRDWLITGNAGMGVYNSGIVHSLGSLRVENNALWGIYGGKVLLESENPQAVLNNGKGDQCWDVVMNGSDFVRIVEMEECSGGGIKADKTSVTAYKADIAENGSHGISSKKAVSLYSCDVHDNWGYGVLLGGPLKAYSTTIHDNRLGDVQYQK